LIGVLISIKSWDEHSAHYNKIEGLRPAVATGTGSNKMTQKENSVTWEQLYLLKARAEGFSPATRDATLMEKMVKRAAEKNELTSLLLY
jgi:hypothetical protein